MAATRSAHIAGQPYRIGRLGPGDIDAMRALLDVFADAFDDSATYRAAPPGEQHLEGLLGRDEFVVLVAYGGDTVVGGLTAYELHKPEQERSEIYIYDLAVAQEHRRKGVASALIRAVQAEAARRGAWVVFVQADLGDDAAIALYSGLGMREDVLHFDIAPAEGGEER